MKIIKCDVCSKLHRTPLGIWGGAEATFGMVDKTTQTFDLCPKCAGDLMNALQGLIATASEPTEETDADASSPEGEILQ